MNLLHFKTLDCPIQQNMTKKILLDVVGLLCTVLILFVGSHSLPVVKTLNSQSPAPSSRNEETSLFSGEPIVYPNPNARVPLVAIVEFRTAVDCNAVLAISGATRSWQQQLPGMATRFHRAAIVGLVPNCDHQIVVTVQSINGDSQSSQPLSFATPQLPSDFPPIRTTLSNSVRMEPGITMFAVNHWKNNVSLVDYGYLIAIDTSGQVVWYCRTGDRTSDFRPLRNGHLLYQHGSYRYLYEIDLLGNDHRCWYASRTTEAPHSQAIAVDVDSLHHEVVELPNGNFMSLATELRRFERYPTSETMPGASYEPAWVVCDEVIEFEPITGRIVERLPLTGLLDTRRFGYLALGGFWREKYDDFLDSPSRDWSHANALQFLPEENCILVSLRHQDCVLKIDWKEKRLLWILGTPKNWSKPFQKFLLKPVGNLTWFFHQHAAHMTSVDTLMMFDNGNYRAVPFETPVTAPNNFSRVVVHRIDAESMTVSQIFDYGSQESQFYSPYFGESEVLPKTGNLLITDGGRIETANGTPSDDVPGQRQWARVFEITTSPIPQKVFETVCESPMGSGWGWSIYRSNRYPSISSHFRIDLPLGPLESRVLERKAIMKINPLTRYTPHVEKN